MMWWTLLSAQGAILSVPGDYATLPEAVAAAEAGDVVELGPGRWAEPVHIRTDLTIRALGAGTTLVSAGSPVLTASDGAVVVVEGLALDGPAPAVRVDGAGLLLDGVTASGATGAEPLLSVVGGALTLDGCTFSDHTLPTVLHGVSSDVLVLRSTLSGTVGTAVRLDAGTLTLQASELSRNAASSSGGAVAATGSVSISDTTFDDNSCREQSLVFAGCVGGAVAGSGVLSVQGGLFRGNRALGADTSGGAVAWEGEVGVVDVSFEGNEATWGGGGLTAEGIVSVDGGVFRGNAAARGGGAVLSGAVALAEVSFLNNEATGAEGGLGGGAVLEGEATATDLFFEGNLAGAGGGLAMDAGTLQGATFVANHADGPGGGLYLGEGDATVIGARLCRNTAESGAGAWVSSLASATIERAVVEGNQATVESGGLGLGAGGVLTLWSSALVANTAGVRGDALFASNAELSVRNTAFVDHPGIAVVDLGAVGTLDYSLFWGNGVDHELTSMGAGEGLVMGDPRWQSVVTGGCDANDYTPRGGSPAIDAGDPERQDPDGSVSDIGPHDPVDVVRSGTTGQSTIEPTRPTGTSSPTDPTPTGSTTGAPADGAPPRGDSASVDGGCGCASGPFPTTGWLWVMGIAAAGRRRG